MRRSLWAPCLGLLMLLSGMSVLAAEPPAGTWKLSFPIQNQNITFLMMFSQNDEKWVGDFLGSSLALRGEPKIEDLVVKDDSVRFGINLGGQMLTFDGRLAKDAKKISGSFSLGGELLLVDIYPSKLKNLDDKYAFAKEMLGQVESGTEFFTAAVEVLKQASAKKEPAAEVRALADRAMKVATPYGPRWERSIALKLANVLADQEPFADIAVEQARRAERLLDPRDDASSQMQVLSQVAAVLRAAGKEADLKTLEARIVKLEARDYQEYAKLFPYKTLEYAGRKGKSDRAVMVELFTGAECPPCVAADLGFDGLDKTYKANDVVLLQYHLHIPGPDPLTNPFSEARQTYYGEKIEGTPTIFFNGKKEPGGGGGKAAAKIKYQAFQEVIAELLEKPATVKLGLTAEVKGDEIVMKATLSELENPSENMVLRFAITEEKVRYAGGNGLRYHHHVVRALPGGIKGFPQAKASGEQTVTVSIAKLREELSAYLTKFASEETAFPNADRPLGLKDLTGIAFLQNDKTQEILQVVRVSLAGNE